jgi:hypothetical protein
MTGFGAAVDLDVGCTFFLAALLVAAGLCKRIFCKLLIFYAVHLS